MSDLTWRARDVFQVALMRDGNVSVDRLTGGRLAVEALAKAGMLADPDAEDPRIAAAWGLVQEWTEQASSALYRACRLDDAQWNDETRTSLLRVGAMARDHAAELRRVLDGDPDTTGDDHE